MLLLSSCTYNSKSHVLAVSAASTDPQTAVCFLLSASHTFNYIRSLNGSPGLRLVLTVSSYSAAKHPCNNPKRYRIRKFRKIEIFK